MACGTSIGLEGLLTANVSRDQIGHARSRGPLVIDDGKGRLLLLPIVRVRLLPDGAAGVRRRWLDRIRYTVSIHLIQAVVYVVRGPTSWLSCILHLSSSSSASGTASSMLQVGNLVYVGFAALFVLL